MRATVSLDVAAYKAQQASSLLTAIMDQAQKECSSELIDLISIASDLNGEIWQSLAEETK